MNEPIRVLIINYKMQCAGIEAFIMNMYRNIDRSKIQFDFLVHYSERQFYDDEIEELGGKIYRLSVREDKNLLRYLKQLNDFFSEHSEYRIVHGHMESFGIFYFYYAKKYGINVRIAHSHIAQRNRGLKGWIKAVLNKGFKKYATDLFACSEIAGDFLFGKCSNYRVFNNAIDTDRFAYNENIRKNVRSELGIADDILVIGHVGRFDTQKNHIFLIDILMELVKINKKVLLISVGQGELFEKIQLEVKRCELVDYCFFLGIRRDIERIYQAMDIFVMPSLFEGLPISGIEAQTAGLKCLFSNTISEQIALTENALFCNIHEPAKRWADCINECGTGYIRRDYSDEIRSMGYDIKEQAKELQSFYLSKNR